VLAATLTAKQSVHYTLAPDRHAYLALARGEAVVNGVMLAARDGAAIRDEANIHIQASAEAEIVLVDAPAG
jgi:VCBS repeat-containing protein